MDTSAAPPDSVSVAQADTTRTAAPATEAGTQEVPTTLERMGVMCTLLIADADADRSPDMSQSPGTMNPCGNGTMTLPRYVKEEQGGY
jgi:hypothetical protein